MKKRTDLFIARVVFSYHLIAAHARRVLKRRRQWIGAGVWLAVAVGSWASKPLWQRAVGPWFATDARFETLRNFLLTVGGALIGATAIASSFVLFAMQVNVERMPHGLFRRLSSDLRLLLAFAGTFAIAFAVAAASLSSDRRAAAALLVGSAESFALTLFLFAYAYRRALRLISPIEQLRIILSDARAEIGRWERRALRAAAFIELPEESPDVPPAGDRPDMARLTFFQGNPAWSQSVLRGVRYATAFSRHYAEQGDHEVSGAALQAIVELNVLYVRAKGKTFFSSNPLIENPLVTDAVVNASLEQIQLNIRIALARDDHQQVEQNLRAFAALCTAFLAIEYVGPDPSKTHALIAAYYLGEAVEAVVAKDMPDVLMEGVRIMGTQAIALIRQSNPLDAISLIEKIGVLGCVGVAQDKLRPVTQTTMDQLAKITLNILQVDHHRVSFTFDNVRQNVSLVAKLFLNVPDQPLASTHSAFLGPYYSSTSVTSLRNHLVNLVNALCKDDVDRAIGENISSNLADWSEGLADTQKELLLFSIERRSQFTFDMITWIVGVTELLLAASNGPACREHDREKLQKNALWLIYTLSWLPRDPETATYLGRFHVTERLFEAAMDARRRGASEVFGAARKLILRWGMEAGAVATGWSTLEKALLALAALALPEAAVVDQLKIDVAGALTTTGAPTHERRTRAARGLRETARDLRGRAFTLDPVEAVLHRYDRRTTRDCLIDLADILDSPEG